MDQHKYVYDFQEGGKEMRSILGGKGAGLAEMTKIGLPVPPGFTISTEMCPVYLEVGDIPEPVKNEIREHLARLESRLGKRFGSAEDPLLVSVRSGAAVSMPGMMDTILNLGLNVDTVEGLAQLTSNPRFAWDSYRRFTQMYGNVVLGIVHDDFEQILAEQKQLQGVTQDTDLSVDSLKAVVQKYFALVQERTGKPFPQDPMDQLMGAVGAVFRSWNTERAVTYRKIENITGLIGTAVTVQSMVFGNMGNDSATGVCFTRDNSTGEKHFSGEYLVNAQGEDVVAGIRTPKNINEMAVEMPETYKRLVEVSVMLEQHYRDMQDMEFTVERGKLFMLQTRNAKRSPVAAVKVAVDMVAEGLISKEDAVMRVTPSQLDTLLHPQVDPRATIQVIARAIPASPGAGYGKVVFESKKAAELGEAGEKVVLVRQDTSPEDIDGISKAQATLTTRGGASAHAALVARGLGKPCVVGADQIRLNNGDRTFTANGVTVHEGDVITVNGTTGEVILGQAPMVDAEQTTELTTLLGYADELRRLGVRANADTPTNARKARGFGAEGIGLCRTERMFNDPDRLPLMQEMVIADTPSERMVALEKLLPLQRRDFEQILEAMDGYPVIIRLLDPPLHEFLPQWERLESELAEATAAGDAARIAYVQRVMKRYNELKEFNPMIGFRGCRVGIVYPEIYRLQVRAIAEAAVSLLQAGKHPMPEIMLPLVGHVNEIKILKPLVQEELDKVFGPAGVTLPVKIGTMVEVPRACLTADEIAEYAEFFSFGTNDLTQTTYAYSRDDAAGTFLPTYLETKVLDVDPFQTIDQKGVGKLVQVAVVLGRKTNPTIEIGICGEQGGDPDSIEFCHTSSLDYVSCSAPRVPVARLAAAQAALKHKAPAT
ncbi:MAG TPA: pyruvate, phosphate dikinase [Candidatus Cryosericum sp.]|nr:pyruvate, phosphate dikinase [Candidatus Cryosericum sp.]